MIVRYVVSAVLIIGLSILAAVDGRDVLKLPSEALKFFSGEYDDDSIGTKWAVLVAGSRGCWNYRHQVTLHLAPNLAFYQIKDFPLSLLSFWHLNSKQEESNK